MAARLWSLSRPQRRTLARTGRRARHLRVEQLEARRVLASWNWTGGAGAGDTNWTTATNWSLVTGPDTGVVGVPDASDDLTFPTGPTNLTANNNFAAGTAFNSISITGGGYSLTGNAVNINSSLAVNNSGTTTLSLAIGSDADGMAFSKDGSGTLNIGGNNTYLGVTTINTGTVNITSSNALGASGAGNHTVVNGSNSGTGTLFQFNPSAAITVPESLTFAPNAAGRVTFNNSAQANVLNGPITINATSASTFAQVSAAGGGITLNGDITGSTVGGTAFLVRGSATSSIRGSVQLTGGSFGKTDDGQWNIGAVGKTYSWPLLQLSRGRLRLDAENMLPATSPVSLGQTDTNLTELNLNGFNQTVSGLSVINFANKSITATTAATLTVNNSTPVTFGGGTVGGSFTNALSITHTGSAPFTIAGGTTTTVNNTATGTLTAAGTGLLSLGNGAVTFTGDGGWKGNIVVNSGSTMQLGQSNIIASTSLITANGTFNFNNFGDAIGGLAGTGSVQLGSATAVIDGTGAGSTQTFSGVISGSGGITVGAGTSATMTQVLTGLNTYTGATTIQNGTLSVNTIGNVGAASALGAPTSAANGTIALGNSTTTGTLIYTGGAVNTDRVLNLAGTTGGGTITQSGTGLLNFTSNVTATGVGSKSLTLQGSTAGTGQIAGIIVDNDPSNTTAVVKAGAGVWTLTNGANSYTGGTTINGGRLTANASGALGTGAVVVAAPAGAQLNLGNGVNIPNPLTINGGSVAGQGSLHVASGSATYSGPINITALTPAGGHFGGGTLTVTSAITSSVDVVFRIGTIILSGTGSAFASATIGQGTLRLGANNALPIDSTLVIAASAAGTFDLNGFSQTLDTIARPGASVAIVDNTAAGTTSVLTLGNSNFTGAYNGVLQNSGVGATLSLTKIGTGTLTLGGADANTYSGPTIVNVGVLALNKTAGINAIGLGGLQVRSTLASTAETRLLANNQLPDTGTIVVDAAISNGAAILNLNNFTDMVGATSIRSVTGVAGQVNTGTGTIILNGDLTLQNDRGASGNTGNEVRVTGNLDLNGFRNVNVITTATGVSTLDGTISAAIFNGTLNKIGNRNLILAGTVSNTQASTIVTNGGLVLNKTAGIDAVGPLLSTTGTGLISWSQNDQIPDNAALSLTSSGTSVLNNRSETFTTLDITNGALNTGGGAATVNVTGITTVSGGALNVNSSASLMILNQLNYTGGAVAIGGGGGILEIGPGGLFMTGETLVINSGAVGATLRLNGDVTVNGSATISILDDNGGTPTTYGRVDLNGGTRTFTINDGSANPDLQIEVPIVNGGIIKAGAGSLTLLRDSSYAGGTTISGGVLSVASMQNAGTDSPLGAGGNIVLAGGVLQYTGPSTSSDRSFVFNAGINKIDVSSAAANLTLTSNVSGTGRFTKVGPGTLTFDSGTSNFGGMDAAGGNLVLANNTSFQLTGNTRVGVSPGSLDSVNITAGTQPTGGILTIQDNASLRTSAITMGENNNAGPGTDITGMVATLNQSGGTVTTFADVGENAGIKLGHWGNETSTYNLSNGVLNIQGAANDLAISTSGTGIFNMTGGQAFSAGVVVNHRAGDVANPATFRVLGGVYTVGSRGVTTAGGTTTVELGNGGTLRASANFNLAVPTTLIGTGANSAVIDTNGFQINVNSTLSNNGLSASDLVKTSTGKLVLANSGSNFSGDFTIQGGIVEVTAGHNDTAPTGALGNTNVPREIFVNSGTTLQFSASDVMGNAGANPLAAIHATGSIVTNTGNFFSTLGPVFLSGATLAAIGGVNGSYQAWRLAGNVTVLGSTPSAITTSGPNSGIHLGAPTVFDVQDVTGNANPDLNMNATFVNQTPNQASAPGSLTKNGAGTMVLANAGSTFTGDVNINQGVVRVTAGHNDTANIGALGNTNTFRNINVNSGTALELAANDIFGNAGANPIATLNLTGSTLTNTGNFFSTLGPVTMNGATIHAIGGANGNYQAYFLRGPMTVTGSTPSAITATGTNSGTHLSSNVTFDVANVTGDAAADLIIGAPLINQAPLAGAATGGLTKVGSGTLEINSTSSYTGNTSINAGTLAGTGSLASAVAVASGAALSPGGSPGTLTVATTTLATGSTYNAELTGSGNDRLNVNGNINLNNATLLATNSAVPAPGQAYILIAPTGSISGTFNGLPENAFVDINGLKYHITYGDPSGVYGTGNTVALIRNNPVVANDDDYGPILVNSTLTGNVKDNDTDLDEDGTVSLVTGVGHGSLTLNADGTFSYTPTSNFIGTDSFVYRLADGEGPGDTATVTIEVTNIFLDGSVLMVSGFSGSDRIIVQPSGAGGVGIRYNNRLHSGFAGVTKVVVYGGGGDDTVTVSNISVQVEFYGQAGNDYLAGGSNHDLLDGGEGNDRLIAGAGNDVLLGGGGADTMSGGLGHDYLSGDDYVDNINGTALTLDQLPDPIFVSTSTRPGKDTMNGENGNDVLIGGAEADRINGGAGMDLARGGLGNDNIDGGTDSDILLGELGSDLLYGRQGTDVLIGGSGNDTLYGATGSDLLLSDNIDAMLDDDAALLLLLADWTSGDYQTTADYLEGFASDDLTSDSLYGEGDADWFLYYFAKGDRIKSTADTKAPNVPKNLS